MGTGSNTAAGAVNRPSSGVSIAINPANEPWRNGNTDSYLVNLASNPANEPWRNGMTDFSLMNLADPGNEPWRNGETDTYLMNLLNIKGWLNDLEASRDFTQHIIESRRMQNLAADPALEPWRNGNTDTYLMNLGLLGDLEKRRDFTKAFINGRYLQNLAIPSGTARGKALGNNQHYIAKKRNTVGNCYAAVADGIDATVAKFLWGNSAY